MFRQIEAATLCLILFLVLQSSSYSQVNSCTESSTGIYEIASPAVVFISATSINPYKVADRVEHIIGSGFIIDDKGLILTNSHVVFGRQSLQVTLDDGTNLPARVLGADPLFDIALIQIPAPADRKLPTLKLGDSDKLKVGDEVLALGNPLGLDQSLTRGIVSAVNRVLPPTFFALREPLIQVDTPINHGNSGGPLLNKCGEAVGITTAMISDAHNIGFVIPSNLARSIIPDLLSQGHVIRPWLGFHGQFIDKDLSHLLRLRLTPGFLVESVEPGSPAEASQLAGGDLEMTINGTEFLFGGDIITAFNGRTLDNPQAVISELQEIRVGDTIKLNVFHDGKTREISYKLTERPLLPGDVASQSAAFVIPKSHSGSYTSSKLKF